MGFLNLFDSWKVGVSVHLKRDVYYPGNVVEGFVEINCSGPITMVAVRVKATGKEKIIVKRQKQVDMGVDDDGMPITETQTETLMESCSVYKQLITLAGQTKMSRNRQSIEVPAGRYTYPFAFQLPVDIPPSFAKRAGDDMADIAYHIKAYVDIPMGRDAQHRNYFTVVKPMPQSQWIARAPSTQDRQWDITFCCCIDKGRVQARMFMDRTHIAMDRDNLVVCADIDNTNGKEPVKSLEVKLMHKLVYTASWVTETNVINEGTQFVNNEIAPGQKGRIAGVIQLPRGLIPSLTTFNVISEYWVDIELNIPMASDPKHRIPVIIAQAVDETNFTPPVTWGSNPYQRIMKGQCPEFYYQPPMNPCYQLNPIPCQPPTGYQYNMWAPQIQPQMPLPAPGIWAAPTAYNIPRRPTAWPPTRSSGKLASSRIRPPSSPCRLPTSPVVPGRTAPRPTTGLGVPMAAPPT